MPLYDFRCKRGHVTEQRTGTEVSHVTCGCGEMAERQAVYVDQHAITSVGSVKGKADRFRRNHAGEKLNDLWQSSREVYRESGEQSGPFEIKDWM